MLSKILLSILKLDFVEAKFFESGYNYKNVWNKLYIDVKTFQRTGQSLSHMALTKSADSTVAERTVSVRPSLNNLVMDASYVKHCLVIPESYNNNTE